jgi:phosphoribosyl-AMP cyclohydrolase
MEKSQKENETGIKSLGSPSALLNPHGRYVNSLIFKEIRMTQEIDFAKGKGLVPVIVQDHQSHEVLMMAYMNQEAWEKTQATGKAHYYSRSRRGLWLKGEESGHYQEVREAFIDCDNDTLLLRVKQLGGGACHMGYRSCFFRKWDKEDWTVTEERIFKPEEVYKK